MWVLLWICAFLFSSSNAAALHINDNRSHRHDDAADLYTFQRRDHLERGSVARIPTCAEACRRQYQINTTTECTHNDVFHSDITQCIQNTCPHLQDVLDWQTYYATTVCGLEPRSTATKDTVVAWTLFIIATLSVVGRLLARSRWFLQGPGFWWDDWLVVALWVLGIELIACLFPIQNNYGGRDAIGVVDAEHVRGMLKWIFISVPFYMLGTYGTKIVWILLYMRMWDFNTAFRKICWVSISMLLMATVGFSVGVIVIMWPMKYYMDNDSPIVRQWYAGIDLYAAVFGVAAINIAMDFWVLLLPIPKLMALTGVSKQKKMGICGVFLLGFICTAISIVRLYYIVPIRNTTNATFDFAPFHTWSKVEVDLSMISCNLPALAGLIKRLRTKFRESRADSDESSAGMTRGLSNRSPPKHTPKLNTWKGGSISMTTSEGQRSMSISEDEYRPMGERVAQTPD